jgi:hypothetical protein
MCDVIQKSVVTINPATCDGPLLKIWKSTTRSTTLGATGSAVNLTLVMENAVCTAVLPLEAYTSWDPRMGILDLYYLLSLFNPYQVQVMRTQIRVP